MALIRFLLARLIESWASVWDRWTNPDDGMDDFDTDEWGQK